MCSDDNDYEDDAGAGVARLNSPTERHHLSKQIHSDYSDALHSRIEEFATTVVKHNEMIAKLMSRLTFVLKFRDISESTKPPASLKAELSKISMTLQTHSRLHSESPLV
jgi:hypothetical protein